MTNILIPSDLSIESLALAEKAIRSLEPRNANIILFHAFEMPDSAFDLLVSSRTKPYAEVMSDAFRQACKHFREANPKTVQKIFFKYLEGSSARLFRNFVDANEIDFIICPDDYHFNPIHKLSVDPKPLFKKSGVPVIRDLAVRRKESIAASPAISFPIFNVAS